MTGGLLILALCGCASWTHDEVAAEVLALAATTGDWWQTQTITANCTEANPLLGDCGQNFPVNFYFPALMVAHAAIATALPHRWRLAWAAVVAGAEVNQVWMNHEVRSR